MTDDNISTLRSLLELTPVMGHFHPLVPLCLAPEVAVVSEVGQVVEMLDSVSEHDERPILITSVDERYESRFRMFDVANGPSPSQANRFLHARVEYARRQLMTHTQVADRVVMDTQDRGYSVVCLLLVDGLSYEDVKDWPEEPQPCFIDGPTITYGTTADGQIIGGVGFPGIVGSPPLGRRLIDVGIAHSRGFSYWSREQNEVSAALFEGTPLDRVAGVAEAISVLETLKLDDTYVQLVREGLDGLAHRRREVTTTEILATVEAIHSDYRRLIALVEATGLRGAVYLMADHGILWVDQHELERLEGLSLPHPRYGSKGFGYPHTSKFRVSDQEFCLCDYPYVGATVRSNESGVHGGLSYWESFVPFIRVEVNV